MLSAAAGPEMAPLSLGGFFGGKMRVPGHANLAECQSRPVYYYTPPQRGCEKWTPNFHNLKKEGPEMAPLSLGGFLGGNVRFRTHKSGRVQKQLQMRRPPLAKGVFGGNMVRHF